MSVVRDIAVHALMIVILVILTIPFVFAWLLLLALDVVSGVGPSPNTAFEAYGRLNDRLRRLGSRR